MRVKATNRDGSFVVTGHSRQDRLGLGMGFAEIRQAVSATFVPTGRPCRAGDDWRPVLKDRGLVPVRSDDRGDAAEIVEAFATALDADDFSAAHRLLDPGCVYEIAGEQHIGPDAVVASFQAGSELAHRLFDNFEFKHEPVRVIDDDTVHVRYLDVLRAGDETYVHINDQRITVGSGGRITHIADQPLAGERARLDAFMARHGIRRPT